MTPSHSGTDRVAHCQPDVIDEVDGVPSTHTPHTAEHDQNVATDPSNAVPLPFGAPFPIGAILALITMSAVVLSAAAMAVLTLYDGHPSRVHILGGLLSIVAIECVLMAALALRGSRR